MTNIECDNEEKWGEGRKENVEKKNPCNTLP